MGVRIVLDLLEKINEDENIIIPYSQANGNGKWYSDYSSVFNGKTDIELAEKIGVLDIAKSNDYNVPMPQPEEIKFIVDVYARNDDWVEIFDVFNLGMNISVTYKDETTQSLTTTNLVKSGDTNVSFKFKTIPKPINSITFKFTKDCDLLVTLSNIKAYTDKCNVNGYDRVKFYGEYVKDKDITFITNESYEFLLEHQIPNGLGVWAETAGSSVYALCNIGRNVSTVGIEVECVADSITVDWYSSGEVISTKTEQCSGKLETKYIPNLQTYDKIKITANLTNGYARIYDVTFGKKIVLKDDDIERCKIYEEEDNLSLSLPSNYCDVTLVSPLFNVWNETDELKALTENTKFNVYYDENGTTTYLGLFHAKDIESRDDGSCHIKAYDWLNVISSYTANNGLTATGQTIYYGSVEPNYIDIDTYISMLWDNLPDTIPKSILKYEDEDASSLTISAYTDRGNVRDMLAYVLANSSRPLQEATTEFDQIFTSRRKDILIKNSRTTGRKEKTYTEDDYFENPKITIEKKPTEIVVKYKDFSQSESSSALVYEGKVEKPTWLYTNGFADYISVFKGDTYVDEDYVTYSILVQPSSENISVNASIQKEIEASVSRTSVAPYSRQIVIEPHTTDEFIADKIASRIEDFYSREFIIDFETEFDDMLCGDVATIKLGSNTFKGIILSQEIDATGGMLIKRKMRARRITDDKLSAYTWGEISNDT